MKIVHGTLQDFHRYWRDAPWAEPQFAAYMDAGKAEFWYARIGLRVVGRVYLLSCRMQMQLMASNGPIYVICTSWSGIAAGELALRC